MSMRYYISTEEASFFNNNSMGYANSIPTSGTYKVGDFIISSTQENGIFGWVCTVAGTPGEWEVIGSGMNNSSSDVMHEKIVGYINAVSFSDARSSIEIGIEEYVKGVDFLEVHYNGLLLAEGVHYNVSEDGKSIEAISDVWNKNADDTQQMIFRVLKSEGNHLKELRNTIEINSACYEVEMGIEGYNTEKDIVEVHLNGVLLIQGIDYEIVEGRISKLDRSEAWNPYNVNGQKMFVKVFRNIANLIEPEDGSVTIDKLAPELASDIAALDDLIDIVDIQNNTITSINDRVAAIEEKIESGDIVTNGGGGGLVKLTYKDNLVKVVNTNTVTIGLPFDKEKDMLEVHIDGLKLAEGVHYNISGDGLKIVKVNGVWNPDSLDDQYIDFRVITAGNSQIEHLTKNVEFSTPLTEVEIGLEYNSGVDILIVHLNGIKLVEGLDFNYVAEGNKIVKIDVVEPWNLYGVDGQLFVIDVLRNVGEKVTMDNLADDVREAIEAAGNIDLSGYDAKIAELEGRVNEAFTNANNGKQLIASAIGEPVSADDTFSAMSNDINSLLATFKTNMMNNGIAVEANDKFKALIDKISTMVEEGSGKGIQYASEAINVLFKQDDALGGGAPFKLTLAELDFEPSIVFIETEDYEGDFIIISSNYHNNIDPGYLGTSPAPYAIINTTATSKQLYISVVLNGNKIDIDYKTSFSPLNYNLPITYHAIGVGEEDTTLRDSLASILEEEGVDVTEEDDMASLITKVDEEFENIKQGTVFAKKIIVTNTLPEVVTDDIVIITDIPATNIYTTQLPRDYSFDRNFDNWVNIIPVEGDIAINLSHGYIDGETYNKIIITYDNIRMELQILEVYQYINGEWDGMIQYYVYGNKNGVWTPTMEMN